MANLASTQASRKSAIQIHPVNGFPAENELNDLRFKLAYKLQTTLNIDVTLDLFYKNVKKILHVAGLDFQSDNQNCTRSLGKQEKHSVKYNLNHDEQHLGALSMSRTTPFAESEMLTIEALIGVLFHPLKNAILYTQALESSMRDPLTKIGNRTALDTNFEREIKLAQRHNHPLALLVLDIDHFKQVNDLYGHQAGDKVIQNIVNSIQHTLRETDQIFRYGGEEFVVLLSNTGDEHAHMIAERIRVMIAMTPIHTKYEDILTSVSIGVSSLEGENDTQDTLFKRADEALYKAKESGRNRVCIAAKAVG